MSEKYYYEDGFNFKTNVKINNRIYNCITKKEMEEYNRYHTRSYKIVGYTDFHKIEVNKIPPDSKAPEVNAEDFSTDILVDNRIDKQYIYTVYPSLKKKKRVKYFLPVRNGEFVGITKKNKILLPILLLILLGVCLLSLFPDIPGYVHKNILNPNPKEPTNITDDPESEPDYAAEVDHNYVYMPLVENSTFSKDSRYFRLKNLPENGDENGTIYQFQYVLTNNDTKKEIYRSEWLESNAYADVDMYRLFNETSGMYNINVLINTRNKNSGAETNGLDTNIIIHIK